MAGDKTHPTMNQHAMAHPVPYYVLAGLVGWQLTTRQALGQDHVVLTLGADHG